MDFRLTDCQASQTDLMIMIYIAKTKISLKNGRAFKNSWRQNSGRKTRRVERGFEGCLERSSPTKSRCGVLALKIVL